VYTEIFDYDVVDIRKISHCFAELLISEVCSSDNFRNIELSEEKTTSSQRIFLKFLF